MIQTLVQLMKRGTVTQRDLFPDLPEQSRGLPALTESACAAGDCRACMESCPTGAITVTPHEKGTSVALDLGKCIACGECAGVCPTGTIASDRGTRVATIRREDLIRTNRPAAKQPDHASTAPAPFRRSLHIREVSTGDNATDLEVAAANNPIFDAGRFGIHFVASPRYADALLVTGPVARAMREPLRRCYEAMADPRIVIAVGAAAISGGLHRESYAQADGVEAVLPVAVYVPGAPPHPWYILHGILLAMGHPAAKDDPDR